MLRPEFYLWRIKILKTEQLLTFTCFRKYEKDKVRQLFSEQKENNYKCEALSLGKYKPGEE